MFAEFEQRANKTENCEKNCETKYTLHANYWTNVNYAVYQIEDEVIITQMKNFFFIDTIYGIIPNDVFSGVQFKDHESQLVKSNREQFHRSD